MTTMEGTTKEVFYMQSFLQNQSLEETVDVEEDQGINVDEVEHIIGYKFNDQTLLRAALTHSSYKRNRSSMDEVLAESSCLSMGTYERLEYVGDAVLNLMMAKDNYFSYPDLSPGMLTRLRAANVDTEKLARAAINLNLHKYLRHEKPILQKQITEFKNAILEYPLHSHGLVEAPKALADIVEFTIGAVFIDCGSCLQTASKIVKNLLRPLITPETIGTHPMTKLYEFCQKHGQKLRFNDLWEENGTVEVFVDDNFVAECKYISKRAIAWNRAANKTYNQIMKLNANAATTDVFVDDNFVAECKYIPKRAIAWNRAANKTYNQIMKLNANAVTTDVEKLMCPHEDMLSYMRKKKTN